MVSCNDMPAIQISEILRFWRTWVTGAAIVLSVIPRGKISSCFVKQIWIFVTVHCLFWLQVKFVAILLSVCHITHGECRKCHGCWKSEWYTTLFHHKDIDPFANYIKKKMCMQIGPFIIIFSVVSSTLLIFPSNTKTLLNNKGKEHCLHCYSFAWRWNLLNFVALPKPW